MSCPSAGKAEGCGEGLKNSTGLQKPSSFLMLLAPPSPLCAGGAFFLTAADPQRFSVHCTQKAMPSVTVTRRMRFNAAHRVFNPAFSDEQNDATFGKCNNPNWHGHNYILDVSVEGAIDDRTGYVMDLARLRDIAEAEVVSKVDHKNFNLDVPFMEGVIPTSENIIVAFWKILEPAVLPAVLKRLALWETENNYVEYSGD
jgi:6-pyruvoyltetrahydropterin/6-carboxytetrahydropterin synthase